MARDSSHMDSYTLTTPFTLEAGCHKSQSMPAHKLERHDS